MWPDLIKKAKDGGLDVIQTYVFWNGHEPSPGKVKISCNLKKYIYTQFMSFDIKLCVNNTSYEFPYFQYNFEGRYDLVKFIKLIQQAGLYVHLRIGPYVCAEWNFG